MTIRSATMAARMATVGVCLFAWLQGADTAVAGTEDDRGFVDESACVRCHESQVRAWTGSHHDLAMQPADAETVLGDFSDARFTHGDVTTRFFRRDDTFFVHTDGADGALADFEVEHVFGVDPLQQLLIGLPGGRLQAFSLAWDTKAKRWFHLYQGEHIDHRDELHWTRRRQNWNQTCGECHATGYRKRYDIETRSYRTDAARMDVGCQACHGPASRHLERFGEAPPDAAKPSREEVKVDFDVDLSAESSSAQVDTCGRCHARRSTLRERYDYGTPLLDGHLPALLEEGLYYADGQIDAEVYVYGSFVQSKMHAKGVRCSDCHDPHRAAPRAQGNALCVSCHSAGAPAAAAHVDVSGLVRRNYDSSQHHHHAAGKPGSLCVDCHAPERTFMVVDPRRDHGFRVPRPDLSVRIGTPNACSGCHTERGARWAADRVVEWYGPKRDDAKDYGPALHAGRLGSPGAVEGLSALASDAEQPAIVRATALDLLARYPGRSALEALRGGLRDPDALVRQAAIGGYDMLAPQQRVADLAALLEDPILAVRIAAASRLAPAAAALPESRLAPYRAALREYEAVRRENADTPEALTALGDLYRSTGAPEKAERLFMDAITLDAAFVPAYVNLADLHRSLGQEQKAESVLRDGVRAAANNAALHGALGLALVRTGREEEALNELAAAARMAPDQARNVYVYAVALHGAGRGTEAIELLEDFSSRRGDRDVLLALAAFKAETGDAAGASESLRKLAAINPDDPALTRRP